MTPRERYLAALRGQPVDRVPLQLGGFHAADAKTYADPRRREIAVRIEASTHFFHHVPTYENRYLVTPRQFMRETAREETAGGVIVTTAIDTPKGSLTAITGRNPASDTVWTVKYPCESREDIETIRSLPWELPRGLAASDLADVPPAFAQRGLSMTGVSSPFVCAAGMMSFESFLELCATDLPQIEELTAVCLERILALLDVVLAPRNIDLVWMGGCEWLTPPMGSPRLYERLVQGPERTVIERIHRGGALSHVHCHGRVRSTLEQAIDRGADYFEPMEPPPDGDITMAEAKRVAAGRMTLGGNVEARLIENEDEAVVERAARAAFEGGPHRFVFQDTAGPLAAVTPRALRNYHRIVDVWEELA